MPRQRKKNKKYDDGSHGHQFNNAKDYFHPIYNEIIDTLLAAIDDRLNTESLKLLSYIENVLIAACQPDRKKESIIIPQSVEDTYSDIDYDHLQAELILFPNSIASYQKRTQQQSCIRSIHEIIKFFQLVSTDTASLYPNIQTLLFLYLTPPLTSCTAERSFSAMRRIKTWVRSTMTQERFENLMILHVHKKQTQSISAEDVMYEFISKKQSRKIEFGNVKKLSGM